MKLSAEEFKNWDKKIITLLGMSGVGKTQIASMLRQHQWFHYSSDYRIGTRYLNETILDNIKRQLMQIPLLRDLLCSDSIHVSNNITIDNLASVSVFLGKLGDPEYGGLSLKEFKHRQTLHRQAEIAAMQDVPEFIHKANHIYNYNHVINDAGGSLCDLDEPEVLEILSRHTLIIYIKATKGDEQSLVSNAIKSPKPLYYREAFLDEKLAAYMAENDLPYVALIQPDDFVRWLFPKLFYTRIPRYEKIAAQYGYTVTTQEIAEVKNEDDFLQLIINTLAHA